MTRTLKKLLSAVLAVIMVLSMIPAVASAKTVEVTEGFSYEENSAGWVEIDNLSEFNKWFRDTNDDSFLRAATKAGKTVTAKLILKADMALNVPAYVGTDKYPGAHNITLDLNGHRITAKDDASRRAFTIYDGTLNLINSKDTGGITMKGVNNATGGILYVNDGTLNMVNVKVTRTQTTAKTTYGGGILGTNGATVNLVDCVLDATGSSSVKNGGVAYVTAGTTLNMYNTRLLGGSALDAASNDDVGGNIHAVSGTINMYGGEISGGYAGYHGGNIYLSSAAVFNMYGGIIKDGANEMVLGTRGGNIQIAKGTFNMYGGELQNGESYNGKSVYVESSTANHINFYGGILRHDTATASSGTTGFLTKGTNSTMTVHDLTIIAPKMKGSLVSYFTPACATSSEKDENGVITVTTTEKTAGTPVAATCATAGYTPYTCACGAEVKLDIVQPAHTWETVAGIEPTCTEAGAEAGKHCSVCGMVAAGQISIKKLGHKNVTDAAVEPDCVNSGLTEGAHCSRCGTVTTAQETVPALGHSYQSTYTNPTTETDGFTTYVCTVCGDTYVEVDEGSQLPSYVATVDGVPYHDLQEALNVGGEIILEQDVVAVEKLVIPAGKTVKLVLNGRTLTLPVVEDNYGMVVNGELTVTGEGTVITDGVYGIGVSATGKLTVEDGNFVGQGVCDYVIGNWGETVINGGRFNGIYNCVNNFNGTTVIYDGIFITAQTDASGTYESADVLADAGLTIYGGSFSKVPLGEHIANDYCAIWLYREEVPFKVDTFVNAINNYMDYAYEGDNNIIVVSDVTLTQQVVVEKPISLNLNGCTLTLADVPDGYGLVVRSELLLPKEYTIVAPGTYGIGVTPTGRLRISIDGVFVAGEKNDYIIGNWGETHISGSRFQGTYCCVNNFAGTTTIVNGEFTTAETDWSGQYEAADILADAGLTVYGGTFSKAVPQSMWAEKRYCKDMGDGTFTMVDPVKVVGNLTLLGEMIAGQNIQLVVNAEGEGLTYQWKYSRNGTTWYNTTMEGNKTDTLTVALTQKRDDYWYRCVVTDMFGNVVESKPYVLNVYLPDYAVSVVFFSYERGIVPAGQSAEFKVEAEGEGLTYRWEYSKNGTTWYNTTMEGYNTDTLTVTATLARNGYQYRCVVTDKYGYIAYSNDGILYVGEKTISTSGPEDQVAVDGKAVFTVNVEGEGLTYRWQYQRADGTKWFDTTMAGYKTAELTVTATKARNGYKYRCIVTDAYGNETVSEVAVLTVE